jgi:hypothetical protein
MRTIGVIVNEGFSCKITEDSDGRVFFTADADIDADGANGQNGARCLPIKKTTQEQSFSQMEEPKSPKSSMNYGPELLHQGSFCNQINPRWH